MRRSIATGCPTNRMSWCGKHALAALLALCCVAGQWPVASSYRVVMKADIVRDFPGMCYDVGSCAPRAINESWAIGPCARAACEADDSGILLEVHYTCPRLQNRPTLMCDIIEDKGLPFPACCPRMICQRHKKAPASTITKPRPFTPHATVDDELRRIPFVLKRFLEVHNTTLLDAIILSRIKALEKQAKRSNITGEIQSGDALITYAYFENNTTENATTTIVPETGTDAAETTTNVTVSATSQSDSLPTTAQHPTTAGTPEIATTTTEAPGTKVESSTVEGRKDLESVSLEVSPLDNRTVDDDFPLLNDAPLPEEAQETTTAQPTIKTTTIASTEKSTTTVQTTSADTVVTTISENQEKTTTTQATTSTTTPETTSTTTVTTTSAAATTEAPTTLSPATTSEAAGERRTTKPLTVPEYIFPTSTQTPATVAQADQPGPTTSSDPQTPRPRKESNLPTIIRSLVDNVFDYYDYIDYYVPGRKRNFTQELPQDGSLPATDDSPAAQSVMELIKERLDETELANITADTQPRVDSSSATDDLPQADETSKQDEPVIVTSDPIAEEKRRQELASKLTVENLRRESVDTATTPAASEAVTTPSAQEPDTTVATRTVPIAIFATTPATASGIATVSPTTTPSTATASEPTSTLSKEDAPATVLNVLDDTKTTASREGDATTTPQTTLAHTTSSPTSTASPTTAVPSTAGPSTPPPNTRETTIAADPPVASTTPVPTQQADGRPSTTTESVEERSAVSTTSERSPTTAEATTGTSTTQLPTTTSESPTTQPTTTTTPSSTTHVPSTAAPTDESSTTNEPTTQRPTTAAPTTQSTSTAFPPPETTQTAQTSTQPPSTTTQATTTRQSEQTTTVAPSQATNEAATSVSTLGAPDTTATTIGAVATPETPQAPSLNDLAGFQADQSVPAAENTTRTSTVVQPKNNDVEYIDYVYYYDYVDLPENNATTNGTATSSTPTKTTSLQQDANQ